MVEVVELTGTPNHRDGTWLRVKQQATAGPRVRTEGSRRRAR